MKPIRIIDYQIYNDTDDIIKVMSSKVKVRQHFPKCTFRQRCFDRRFAVEDI